MIRYYPDIIVQNKRIKKLQKKLGYDKTSGDPANQVKSTKKPTSAELRKDMFNEHWNILSAHYAKKHSVKDTAKKFHLPIAKVKKNIDFYNSVKRPTKNPYGNHIMFGPGFMPRTIGGNAHQLNYPIQVCYKRYKKLDKELPKVEKEHQKQLQYYGHHKIRALIHTALKSKDIQKSAKKLAEMKKAHYVNFAMVQHGLSLADMTDWVYKMRKNNPNTMRYWYPPLMKAYDKSDHFFKVPKTKIWTVPIEVAQYLQTDYQQTNQISRDAFNKLCVDIFDLKKDKTYFIKTGVFSGKFEFRNCHCKEPMEMGEYFHVINNFAMQVGAASSIDLCVREWIPDPEHRPTIYDGMPLRTEFRSFIDFDKKQVLGIVPYWNPIVMDAVLQRQGAHNPAIQKDYQTYRKNIPFMMKEFNQAVPTLNTELTKLIQHMPKSFHGKWSLDIMKSGKQFYLIDMATMKTSALKQLLPKYSTKHQSK